VRCCVRPQRELIEEHDRGSQGAHTGQGGYFSPPTFVLDETLMRLFPVAMRKRCHESPRYERRGILENIEKLAPPKLDSPGTAVRFDREMRSASASTEGRSGFAPDPSSTA